MKYIKRKANLDEGEVLADIRVKSMKESLEAIGRFNPETARNRFLDSFNPDDTALLLVESEIIGFYVINHKRVSSSSDKESLHLAHLYLLPEYQCYGIGGKVLASIKAEASKQGLSLTVGALRQSRSNDFYINNGFSKTHEDEWDIYYEIKA